MIITPSMRRALEDLSVSPRVVAANVIPRAVGDALVRRGLVITKTVVYRFRGNERTETRVVVWEITPAGAAAVAA